jgi:hypothetical protein
MTRKQRAMACAIAIVPVSAAGLGLVLCGCVITAYSIELLTAVMYLVFIMAAPRS